MECDTVLVDQQVQPPWHDIERIDLAYRYTKFKHLQKPQLPIEHHLSSTTSKVGDSSSYSTAVAEN
jgi:hypothetical protein